MPRTWNDRSGHDRLLGAASSPVFAVAEREERGRRGDRSERPSRRRRKNSRNGMLWVVVAIVGGVAFLGLAAVTLVLVMRGGEKGGDKAGANVFNLFGKDDASSTTTTTTGDRGVAARKAGWWESPTSEKDGYTIWMPREAHTFALKVNLGTFLHQLPGGWVESHMTCLAENSSDYYFVMGRQLDWVAPPAERQKLVHQLAVERREAAMRDRSNPLVFGEVTDYVQDGFPGCEVPFTGKPNVTGAIRLVHAGDKLYALFVGGPTVAQNNSIKTFFDSFRVLYTPDPNDDSQVTSRTNPSRVNWEPEWLPVPNPDGFEARIPGRATQSGTSWTWSRRGEIFSISYQQGKTVDQVVEAMNALVHPLATTMGFRNQRKSRGPLIPGSTELQDVSYSPNNQRYFANAKVFKVGDRVYTITVVAKNDPLGKKFNEFVSHFRLASVAGKSPSLPAR